MIAGDLSRLACDGWLIPTDHAFRISGSFAKAVGALVMTTMVSPG